MLTAEARHLLRTIGTWPCADLILQPDTGGKTLGSMMLGGTIDWLDGQRLHFECHGRYADVFAYEGDPADETRPMRRRHVFMLRYRVVADHAATLSPEVRGELQDARRAYHQEAADWARAREVPPGKTPLPCIGPEWDAHMARSRETRERLTAALAAAIDFEEPVAEQLDLFGALA